MRAFNLFFLLQSAVHANSAALQHGDLDWALHTSQAVALAAISLQGWHLSIHNSACWLLTKEILSFTDLGDEILRASL